MISRFYENNGFVLLVAEEAGDNDDNMFVDIYNDFPKPAMNRKKEGEVDGGRQSL